MRPIPSLGKSIVQFASWIIARRISDTLGAYGILEMVAAMAILTGITELLRSVFNGGVVVTIRDLLVTVVAFLFAAWIMESLSTAYQGDNVILLTCTLFIMHMVFTLMGDVY